MFRKNQIFFSTFSLVCEKIGDGLCFRLNRNPLHPCIDSSLLTEPFSPNPAQAWLWQLPLLSLRYPLSLAGLAKSVENLQD